ncbi:MAG: hypothetical protein AB8H79_25410 [Myxococcota bacterium]
MIQIDGVAIEPGIHVVIWLRQAVQQGSENPGEMTPAERLTPALKAASEADRERSAVALVDALEESDNAFRMHIFYALQGIHNDALTDRYADLLEPAPARWLTDINEVTGKPIAEAFFRMLAHGPGTKDDRLIIGMRFLAKQAHLDDQALRHFVSFHAKDHGIQMLNEHLDKRADINEGLGWSIGMNFAADAPQHLLPLAKKLSTYDESVRTKFLEGAAIRLQDKDKIALKAALNL